MKIFRKLDFILMASLLVLSLIAAAILWAVPFEGTPVVAIYINGEMIETYPLEGDTTVTIPIQTVYGENTVIIEQGAVWVDHADCPKENCVAQGAINRIGGIIVCAPHRLVIRIEGRQGDDLDGVTY